MTIFDNIAYGLRVKKVPKDEVRTRTEKVISLMRLDGMETRNPGQLSGGQQQRVALARAIVIEPTLLLFDEPLSNLDAKLREYMRDELRKLQRSLGITSLYVTHDQAEAMAISDSVVIMESGNVVQAGSPKEIYRYPNSRFVANFMGKANFIPVVYAGNGERGVQIKIGETTITLADPGESSFAPGEAATLVLRPESIKLTHEKGVLNGVVMRKTYYGPKIEYEIDQGEQTILAEIYDTQLAKEYEAGETVGIQFESSVVRLLKDAK
jgi:iron(III) transport system ATP-binding protein